MATTLSLLRFAPLPPRLTRSPLTINLTPSPNRLVRIRPRIPPISASYTVPAVDRAISMLTYIIPFIDSLSYSFVHYLRHPLITSLASPFLPMFFAYKCLPRLDFLAFFILYVAVAVNPHVSIYVRFNAIQAMMLDVMLFLPPLATHIFGFPKTLIGFKFWEFSYGAIFVVGYVTFVYIVLCCLVGHTPYLPFVSCAVDKLL